VYAMTARAEQQSVASVTSGAVDDELPIGSADNPSFLLLDVREEDAYSNAHIVSALSLPTIRLRRDQYPPAVLRYRNAVDKVIIVYDERDSLSTPRAAHTAALHLLDRGCHNVRVLAGGIERFRAKFGIDGCSDGGIERGAATGTARGMSVEKKR